MNDKKFTIVRYIIISISFLLLLFIIIVQENEIKNEEIIIDKTEMSINDNTIIDLAKIYITNNQDYFSEVAKEKDFEFRIDTEDLVKAKLIDNSNNIKGYVRVYNDEFTFVKTDNLLIDNINEKDYSICPNNENDFYDLKYIYKGSNPKNYIKYNNKLYRIIGITNSNILKAIDTENTVEDHFGLSGDINYLKTKGEMEDVQNKGIFYVGYVRSKTTDIDQIMKNEKRNNTYTVGNPKLIYSYAYSNVSDIINASDNCSFSGIDNINIDNCNSYLIDMLTNTYLVNTAENNMIYKIDTDGKLITSKLEENIMVKRVIYINGISRYKSGDGSIDSPYEIE